MTRGRAGAVLAPLLALAGLGWALVDPRFRNAEGALTSPVCLALALGVALTAVGMALATPLRRFALWAALALVGQAVALQLIDAGPLLHYQHYRSATRLLRETHPLLLLGLATQAAVVAAGLWVRWRAVRAGLAALTGRQLAGIGLVWLASSAVVSPHLSDYAAEVVVATLIQLVSLANVVLAVSVLPGTLAARWERRLDALLDPPLPADRAPRGFRGLDRFAVVAAAWAFALAALLSWLAYERHPHVTDEVVYLLQARFLAQGALTLPAPPVPEAFEVYLMQVAGDRWYPAPPPGWPLVLAAGVLLGAPWLVNPLLAGANVLLTARLIGELYDCRTTRLVVLLMAVSPWHLFMAMNFMTHTVTLTGALLGAVAILQARATGAWGWGAVAGAAVGLVGLVRPLDGAIVGVLLGAWALGLGERRLALAPLAAFALGTAVVGGAVLPYNARLTGDPLRFPIMVYDDQRFAPNANAYGFGPDRGMGWPLDPFPGHGPIDALINANLNTAQLHTELFGWSTGSLLLAILVVLSGRLRPREHLMLVPIAVTFAAYFFYYFSGGPDFGARYWFLMLVPLLVLTVGGLEVLGRGLRATFPAAQGTGGRVTIAILLLSAMALLNYVPWRAIDKYHRYLRMRPDVERLAEEHRFGRSLVLIRGEAHPDFASAAVYNPLDPRAAAPVYAWDRSPRVRAAVLSAYADRPVWIVEGPTITRAGYRVAAGPLSAGRLLAE